MADGEKELVECDCCGKLAVLQRCWPMGIETFACDDCRGIDDEGQP